jgi:hypothetical protein
MQLVKLTFEDGQTARMQFGTDFPHSRLHPHYAKASGFTATPDGWTREASDANIQAEIDRTMFVNDQDGLVRKVKSWERADSNDVFDHKAPQRGKPEPAAVDAAGATPAASAPAPVTTADQAQTGERPEAAAEQPTIFGPGPADPPLPAGIVPDHGWVKGLTASAEAGDDPLEPEDVPAAPVPASVPDEEASTPPPVNALPEPSPAPIPAPELPAPPMQPAPVLAQFTPPPGPTPPPLGMPYQPPEQRTLVTRDGIAAAQLRYNAAMKALNNSPTAIKALEPAAQKRGLSVKEVAHLIIQEFIALEQKVLSEF